MAENKYTGAELKRIREKAGMGKIQFSKLFGRDYRTYSKVEDNPKKLHGLWQLIIRLIHKHGIELVKDVQIETTIETSKKQKPLNPNS